MNIKVKNLDINYTINGEGEAYLLLHGWGANMELYKGITDNISKYAKIYAIDLPGFGKSEEPKEGWNVDQFVDLIIEFIEKIKIKKVNLIGHSFGGRIIIKLLNRSELKFETGKVILIGSAGIKHKLSLKKKIKVRMYKLGKKVLSLKLVQKIFPNKLEELKQKSGSPDYRNASPIMKQCLVKCINEDLTNLLSNIKNEVLLIWGENDTETPLQDAKIMNKLIKNSGLVEIKYGTHYVFLEQTQYVNRIIDAYIKTK